MNGLKPGVMRGGDASHSLPTIQGRVVINAKLDVPTIQSWMKVPKSNRNVVRPFGADMKTANLGAVAGEITYRLKGRRTNNTSLVVQPNQKKTRIDSALVPVLSALNGMVLSMDPSEWDSLTDSQKEAYLWSLIKVAGIVGTTREYDDMVNENGRVDLANLLGGVWGMINNNSRNMTIYAGNLVVAAFPPQITQSAAELLNGKGYTRERIQGIEPDKILLETLPYDPSNIITPESLKSMLDNPSRGVWPTLQSGDAADIYTKERYVQDMLLMFAVFHCMYAGKDAASRAKSIAETVGGLIDGDDKSTDFLSAARDTLFPPDDVLNELKNTAPALVQRLHGLGHKFLNGAAVVKRQYDDTVIGIALGDAPPYHQFDIKEGVYSL